MEAGLYIPCGNTQTMSHVVKTCHCLCDDFPPCQHQQHCVTSLSAPTMPNSQPHHYKQMQIKGPNNNKRCLSPKSKLLDIVFFCFTNCPPQVCYYRRRPSLLHPHIVCALHMLSVPSTHCLCPLHITSPLRYEETVYYPRNRGIFQCSNTEFSLFPTKIDGAFSHSK